MEEVKVENGKTKKTLVFKLIYETLLKRYYSLSFGVDKISNKSCTLDEVRQDALARYKPEFKGLIEKETEINYVCVSDARTHPERLLFWALVPDITVRSCKKGVPTILTRIEIDGKHSYFDHAGARKTIHPNEVYLRRLASKNGYNYKVIK